MQLLKEVEVDDFYFVRPIPAKNGVQFYADVLAWLIGYHKNEKRLTLDVLRITGMTSDGRVGTASESDVCSSSDYGLLRDFLAKKGRRCYLSAWIED